MRSTLLAACAAFVVACAPAHAAKPRLADAAGLHVTGSKQVDDRLLTVRMTTPALSDTANVWILLPTGYTKHPRRRYPVLYLLHGTSGDASDWVKKGDAARTTAGLPVIVVMPDIAQPYNGGVGGGGWCTDWVNGGAYGPPKWETFHISQVIPWVDANLRTVASRGSRAIAGLSQGGFCSTSYAARHPDLFSTVAAYSGAVETTLDVEAQVMSTAVVNATEVGLDGAAPNSMFGDRLTNQINWAAHDPAILANNLRDTHIYMYTGNGRAGPLDDTPLNPGGTAIEAPVHELNELFDRRLSSLGIPHYYDDYGPGTHIWPYWARDLRESIGPIVDDLTSPDPPPSRITFKSADQDYSVYGWDVRTRRGAREFSTLADAGASGFALSGSGAATVITPPFFKKGRTYSIRIKGDTVARNLVAVAGDDRRLHVEVPLGPSNPYAQYSLLAELPGTRVYTTRVSIRRQ